MDHDALFSRSCACYLASELKPLISSFPFLPSLLSLCRHFPLDIPSSLLFPFSFSLWSSLYICPLKMHNWLLGPFFLITEHLSSPLHCSCSRLLFFCRWCLSHRHCPVQAGPWLFGRRFSGGSHSVSVCQEQNTTPKSIPVWLISNVCNMWKTVVRQIEGAC